MSEIERRRALLYVLGGLLTIYSIWGIGDLYFDDWLLDLGSITVPAPAHAVFLLVFAVIGGIGAAMLGKGVAAMLVSRAEAFEARLLGADDRSLVVAGSLAAGVIAALVRAYVLEGALLTEDESSYRFMAELLATGRVSAESHPLKLFFDRATMANDGALYSQYFLGWPLLRVIGVVTPLGGYTNALLHALTFPALFYVARDLGGRRGALLASLLFLCSPFLFINAATQLSHTSCVFALAWCHYAYTRARDAGHLGAHAGVALAFSLAFATRPVSAIGIGVPLLVAWAASLRQRERSEVLRAVGAFVLVAGIAAAVFLAAIAAQTGDPFKPAYQAVFDYYRENAWRYSSHPVDQTSGVANMELRALGGLLAHVSIGVLRANFALFGWPASFIFAAFARGRATWLPWAMVAAFLAVHLPVEDSGIDSFAPVHYTELCWPVILLSAVGAAGLARTLKRLSDRRTALSAVFGVVIAMCACSFLVYLPVRVANLGRLAEGLREPFDTVEEAGARRAVVFANRPFTVPCTPPMGATPRGFLFFMPQNDPALENDVLWANHLNVENDRRLIAEHFPDRRGWILDYHGCVPILTPLDEASDERVSPGRMRLHLSPRGMIWEPYDPRFPPDGALPPGYDPRSGPPAELLSSP